MSSGDLGVHYVSHKVNAVRWRPSLKPGLQASGVFAIGSWDNGADNTLGVYGVGADDAGDANLIAKTCHAGDVTDVHFLSHDYLVTTSSSGSLTLFEHQRGGNQSLNVKQKWNLTEGAVLTGMAIKGEDVAAVGEAGDIHLVHLGVSPGGPVKNNSASQHRVIKSADSFTLSSVIYLKPQEVLTANSSGQLKMWDLRQALKNSADAAKPSKILLMSGERIGVTALAQHPTQPHILASGGADGLLTIWDLRQDKAPATLLQGHSSPVWDIKFHPSQPDHLFTCADEGKVLHWDAASVVEGANKTKGLVGSLGTSRVGPLSMAPSHGVNSQSPWIASGTTGDKKSNIVTSTLLPSYFNMSVNSMDIESDILICGTDAEAIFTVRNLNIH